MAHASLRSDVDSMPWYCYGWTWFLMAIPVISIALGVSMLYLGLSTNNSLVVDDYYKQGKAINQRIARDALATEHGIRSEIEQAEEGLVLNLSHSVGDTAVADAIGLAPDALRLLFVHVTRADLDVEFNAQHIGAGRYIAQGANMPTSDRWRVHIYPVGADGEDPPWRLLSGEITMGPRDTLSVTASPGI